MPDPVLEAKVSQGRPNYFGVDHWRFSRIQPGKHLVQFSADSRVGDETDSRYFTNRNALYPWWNKTINTVNAQGLAEVVQIEPRVDLLTNRFDYPRYVKIYKILRELPGAESQVQNNPTFGKGGAYQFFSEKNNAELIQKGYLEYLYVLKTQHRHHNLALFNDLEKQGVSDLKIIAESIRTSHYFYKKSLWQKGNTDRVLMMNRLENESARLKGLPEPNSEWSQNMTSPAPGKEKHMTSHSSSKKDFVEAFAEEIITGLKEGTAPFVKPWSPGSRYLPYNASTGATYQSGNAIHLMMAAKQHGFNDLRWLTFNQAKTMGCRVKKGAKGIQISVVVTHRRTKRLDDTNKPILDDNKKPVMDLVRLQTPYFKTAYVFNGDQVEGLPPPELKKDILYSDGEIDQMVKGLNIPVHHDQYDRAYYNRRTDDIHLPDMGTFSDKTAYYAVLLHEIAHATGHETRLNRDTLGHPFGSPEYAKEELKVQISSWMMGDEFGCGFDPQQHTAYIDSWIQVLENDPSEILTACSDAKRIRDYIVEFDREKTVANTIDTRAPMGSDRHDTPSFIATPQDQFKTFLEDAGLIIPGDPIMDGKMHRVPVEGGGRGKKDGAYVGYSDGWPAGFVQNHKSGFKGNWKAEVTQLSKEKLSLQIKDADRRKAQEKKQADLEFKAVSNALTKLYKTLPAAPNDHNYLATKNVKAYNNIRLDSDGNLVIPIYDVDTNQLCSFQRIGENGFKQFEKGGRLQGNAFKIGGNLNDTSHIFIAEGYSTGATVYELTKIPVVVAFNSGNLITVAERIKDKFPDASIIIAGDNDRWEKEHGASKTNAGKDAAIKAATKVSGDAALPPFERISKKQTDWNDYRRVFGTEFTLKALLASMHNSKVKHASKNRKSPDPDKAQQPLKARGDIGR